MNAQLQEEHQNLPDTDRLSVVTASILLAYALLPFVDIPERNLVVSLLGVLFVFEVQFSTVVALIGAGLAAAGTGWLLDGHPHARRQPRFQQWLIPALTAWVIVVPLINLEVGPEWWAVFGFGGLLLVLVFIAEYIAVDPDDSRHAPAAIGLTAVAYALFLILSIALAGAGVRLYALLPALFAAVFFVTLRVLHLRLGGRWCLSWSFATAMIVTQSAAALHYWPLSPLRFGLLLLGLVYGLVALAGSIEENRPWGALWVEPAIMLVILIGLALLLRG